MNCLRKRYLRPEIMDDSSLEVGHHHSALQGLQLINILSGIAGQNFRALAGLAEGGGSPLKVLDIATGGGDIPIALAKKVKRRNLPFKIAACDKSQTAMDYARLIAKKKNINIDFFQHDISIGGIPAGYDVISCNLFLHHLPVLQTYKFLKNISRAARIGVIVNDLQRCWPGLILSFCVPPLLTASAVVHQDGIQSVRAAYSLWEIKRIAERAGLKGSQIRRMWPFRYQLVWKKGA